jgi:abortive infection bacteriophage resistance protein
MPVPYNKTPLTFQEQLTRLKNRGLIFKNEKRALFLLEQVSYYRLSGYWYPFIDLPKSDHIFKPKSTFDKSFSLYCFDRELRKLLNSELEKIEVAIRAKMIYIMSHSHGPFWYLDKGLFSKGDDFDKTIKTLKRDYERSHEEFIAAFKINYTDPMPPSWMMFEITSFGTLSYIYKNLKPGKNKRQIANHFGLDEVTFTSWLHSIVYIRNLCAHHSRLWNRELSVSPVLPIKTRNQWLNNTALINTLTGEETSIQTRTYSILSATIYLLNIINPYHRFREKFFKLMKKYNNVDYAALGFTSDWKSEPLWQKNSWKVKFLKFIRDLSE